MPQCSYRPRFLTANGRSVYAARRLAWISLRLTRHSAICTALSAAPLRRLSETHQSDSPLSTVGSSRTRLTISRAVADAFDRGDVAAVLALIDQHHAGRLAQDVLRLLGGDLALELDVDRFGMADEHRHAHAGRVHLDLGIEDLLGLDHHLPFFLGRAVVHEDVDVRNHVEGDLLGELVRRDFIADEDRSALLEQLVHRRLAGARDRLIGRDHHALDRRRVVQRLERDDHLRGRPAPVYEVLRQVAFGENP